MSTHPEVTPRERITKFCLLANPLVGERRG